MISTFEFSGHVVGLVVKSDLDEALLNEIHQTITERFKEHRRLNLFVEIERGVDFPVHLMLKDILFKLRNPGEFGKIAVVTEDTVFKNVMKIKDLIMKAEVEAFPHEDRIKAMNWITE